MNPLDLLPADLHRGKSVFITGGSSGINLGIARVFAATGAGVGICGRDSAKLAAAARELESFGGKVFHVAADVRDAVAVASAIDRAGAELGPLNTVICGAAGNFNAPAERISANGFGTVVAIDLLGSFHAAHAGFEQLKQTRGSVIFISAPQAYMPWKYQAHAGAAKAGVENLMKNLAYEWGPYGIRSNSIVPGPIADTEGLRKLSEPVGEDVWRHAVPMGRFGRVDEVGAMAAVLASPLAGYVTGCQVTVDGGFGLAGMGLISRAVDEAVAETGWAR